ncbi:retrotransposon protein, putative, ty1-copia subclass [Tanacetum coccineum]
MVLGIVPVVIIDRQLPFEYTITSRSTNVVVMAQPVQNINHSAFRSMFEREKLSGNNFNDWFRQLKLVLRVEKKMYVIEQPLPAAPAADSEAQVLSQWNAVYDAYNEVACLILGSMTPELHRQFENSSPYDMIKELKAMFEKQAGVERFDLIQTFHACKQEEGKPVAAYVIQMKGYVDQLERLGYMLPQDLIVGLILNGLTKDFAGFVRNYNMHNMGKTIGELHAMLIEYEKGLPKKAETPQVMMIKGGKIQKANKKSLKAKGQAKDDTCHHCKGVGHWKRNCPIYLAGLLKKKNKLALLVLQDYALESATRILNMVPTKKVDKTPYELWYGKVPNLSYLKATGYLKETMGYYFYFPHENKIVVARYVEFFEKNLITQEVSGRAIDLDEIQDADTSPSEITSEIPMEVEAEEHSLGDLNEPTSYKAAMLDSESNKWIECYECGIQSIRTDMLWVLSIFLLVVKTVGVR